MYFTKFKSKLTIDLNGKQKTLKLSDDNIVGDLDNLEFVNEFLNTLLKAPSLKEIIDKLYIIKIKILRCAKNTDKKMNKEQTGKN